MSWLIRFRITRWIAAAIVLALLAAGTAGAAPVRPAPTAPAGESLLSVFREWLGSFFVRPASPPATPAVGQGAPAKAGCGMDPDGRTIPCPPK
ncbi:MAG: hypothetical protein QOF89_3746 [Acidobacteriota bacterium]|jgi:hypothetical protein|nr:hypothetical protein [Acidobacteriota bacterium]